MKKALILASAFMLVTMSAIAVCLPLADLYATEGQGLLDEWTINEWLLNEEEQLLPPDWLSEQAQRYVALAVRLDPWNAEALTTLCFLREAQFPEEGTGAERGEHVKQVLDCYRRAIGLRPASPHAWTGLALFKLQHDELDRELALAMERATTLGPWEKGTQFSILEAALPVWSALSFELREIVGASVNRALRIEPSVVMALAEEYGHIEGTIGVEEALELGLVDESPPD